MIINISYQTQTLPPPYAFALVISAEVSHEVTVNFQMEYLDREELSEEEILAEGFTLDDDLQWKGKLGNNWKDPLSKLKDIRYQKDPFDDSYVHVQIDSVERGFPSDWMKAERLTQELIQAVFEGAERELPLRILISDEKSISIDLEWLFKERIVRVNGKSHSTWGESQKVLEAVYTTDFQNIKPYKNVVPQSVNLGEKEWYPLSQERWEVVQKFLSQL